MNDAVHNFPQVLSERLTPDKVKRLIDFVELIKKYNLGINLVSRKDIANIWENHVYPSIAVDQLVQIAPSAKVVDVGSGGGLPAIPLKIIRPDLKMTLIDSVRKKTIFLKKVVSELNLSETEIMNTRIGKDDQRSNLKFKYDVLTVRGVASFDKLISEFSFLLQPGGYILAWKGVEDLPALKIFKNSTAFALEVFSPTEDLFHYSRKIKALRIIKITSIN